MIRLASIRKGLPFAAPMTVLTRCQFTFDEAGLEGEAIYRHATDPELEVTLPPSLSRAIVKRRAEFLAGRFCAAQAMRRLRGYHLPVAIRPDRSPAWPDGLVGSISHTDGLAFAGVAEARYCRSLGLDLEWEMGAEVAIQVAPLVLDDAEWRLRPSQLSNTAFATLAFSAKEALYKAIYPITNQTMDFHDARLLAVEQDHVVVDLAPEMRSDQLTGTHFRIQYVFEDRVCLTMLSLPA
jgi:enterobactin synthetase component D